MYDSDDVCDLYGVKRVRTEMILILLLYKYFIEICYASENASLQMKIVGGFDCHPRSVPYLVSSHTVNFLKE